MLTFKNVRKTFHNGVTGVNDMSFQAADGEFLVLIGPSGSGKSTTMKMINRMIPHTKGQILINGEDIDKLNAADLRRDIGYVIQQIGLFPHYTIEKNIAIVPQLKGWSKEKTQARVKELMNLVGLDPDIYLTRYPQELSGGQQQRVGVARALAADPEIILMDEPFGALDPITRDQLQGELLSLQKKLNKTIIFVTHDMDEALRLGDRIAIMKDGDLVQIDTPEKILREPADEFVQEFVGKHQIIQNPELMPVTEVMRNKVVTSTADRSPEKALSMLRQQKITNLIIVNDDKEIIGSVTAEDVMRKIDDIDTLAEIMIPTQSYLQNTATAKDAILLMDASQDGIIPVVNENQHVVGLVTRGTLLSAMSQQWTTTEEEA